MHLATIPVTVTARSAIEDFYTCPSGYEVDFGSPAGVVTGNPPSDIERNRILPQCVLDESAGAPAASSGNQA